MVLNLVVQETATVISMKVGQEIAKDFYQETGLLDQEIQPDDILEEQVWRIFMKQVKKGTSFIDCANPLAFIDKYYVGRDFVFDKPPKKKIHWIGEIFKLLYTYQGFIVGIQISGPDLRLLRRPHRFPSSDCEQPGGIKDRDNPILDLIAQINFFQRLDVFSAVNFPRLFIRFCPGVA